MCGAESLPPLAPVLEERFPCAQAQSGCIVLPWPLPVCHLVTSFPASCLITAVPTVFLRPRPASHRPPLLPKQKHRNKHQPWHSRAAPVNLPAATAPCRETKLSGDGCDAPAMATTQLAVALTPPARRPHVRLHTCSPLEVDAVGRWGLRMELGRPRPQVLQLRPRPDKSTAGPEQRRRFPADRARRAGHGRQGAPRQRGPPSLQRSLWERLCVYHPCG